MKQTVYEQDFVESFDKMDRSSNFTVAGRRALYNALIDFEDSTGIEQDLDVIGLCCTFTEYADFAEYKENYSDDAESIDDLIEAGIWVIPVKGESFIIEAY